MSKIRYVEGYKIESGIPIPAKHKNKSLLLAMEVIANCKVLELTQKKWILKLSPLKFLITSTDFGCKKRGKRMIVEDNIPMPTKTRGRKGHIDKLTRQSVSRRW